jgi:predicted amidophosphoribosyltransferase
MTGRVLAELVAAVAPPACVACRAALVTAGEALCPPCRRALPWLRGARCPRCALPRHGSRACPAARAAFDAAWSPLAYDATSRAVVHALKFQAALPVARLMAGHVAATLPAELRDGAVVPVPAQRRRLRRRGFDPAHALAAALAPRLGLPLVPALRRLDRGGRQVHAGRAARRRAAMVLEARRVPPVVLLVDDVHTTGATLDACARALKAAGARRVSAVTYARTL